MPIIKASKENIVLDQVFYIYYLIQFKKNKIQAPINSNSKINAMIPAYSSKLNLKIYCINIKAQKIDGSIFEIFKIFLASFQIKNKLRKAQFF